MENIVVSPNEEMISSVHKPEQAVRYKGAKGGRTIDKACLGYASSDSIGDYAGLCHQCTDGRLSLYCHVVPKSGKQINTCINKIHKRALCRTHGET